MWKWAWKSLFAERAGVLGSAAGIAGAFILVLFFDAVLRGESGQIVAYIREMNADVWVMQRGVGNMHMATSFIWDWKADAIAKMPGVQRVTPILYMNGIVDTNGRRSSSYIVGLAPGDSRAGPWELAAGRTVQGPGEAVIPAVLAHLAGARIGDEVTVTDKPFRVVGLSSGTYSAANAITFVPMPDLEDILSSTGAYSFLLVDAVAGVDPMELAARIRNEIEKVNAVTEDEFIRNDFGMSMQMGVEIIFLMTLICAVLAALIVGFTAYSMVMKSRRELAVAKALGVTNASMIAGVVFQAVAVTLLGFVLAVAAAFSVIPSIPVLLPQLVLTLSGAAVARIGIIALVVAVIGAVLPAYAVSRVDPASAFQG